MPDLFQGDSAPEERGPEWDRNAWLARHGPDSWEGVVDAVVAALKAEGVTRIGTTGYCFGAPPAFYLAFKNEAHVTVLSHPSRLIYPDDLEVGPSSSCERVPKLNDGLVEIQSGLEGSSVDQQLRDGSNVPAGAADRGR